MTVLIILVLIGLIPAAIAQKKGQTFVIWWLYGAALFIVALPHAILLAPKVEDWTVRTCPYCAETIRREATVCRFCGRDMPSPREAGGVVFEE